MKPRRAPSYSACELSYEAIPPATQGAPFYVLLASLAQEYDQLAAQLRAGAEGKSQHLASPDVQVSLPASMVALRQSTHAEFVSASGMHKLAQLPCPVAYRCLDDGVKDAQGVPSPVSPVERWEMMSAELLAHGAFREDDVKIEEENQHVFEPELEPAWSMSKAVTKSHLFFIQAQQISDAKKRATPPPWCTASEVNVEETLCRYLMLTPNGFQRLAWNTVGGILILYDMLIIPLLVFNLQDNVLTYLNFVTLSYWALDIPLNFFTGFHDEGHIEMRLTLVAWHYVRSWFPIDVGIVAIDAFVMFSSGGFAGAKLLRIGRVTRFLRVLRVLRLMRMFKLKEARSVIQDFLARTHVSVLLVTLAQQVLILFFLNHYVGCMWYGMGTLGLGSGNESGSWLLANEMDSESPMYQYTVSLHWSLTQFSPSTQNISPVNLRERLFAIGVVLFAIITFSSFLSSITSLLTQLKNFNAELQREEGRLRDFFSTRRVKLQLRDQIWHFFRSHHRKRKPPITEGCIPIFHLVPESLLLELRRELYLESLTSSPIFAPLARLEMGLFERLCHIAMGESSWSSDQDIFVSGSTSSRTLIAASGKLIYTTILDLNLYHAVRAGDWIAELCLWMKWAHCGRLVAETGAKLVEVRASDFHDAVHSWGGPQYLRMRTFAVFLLGHIEGLCEASTNITDLSIGHEPLDNLTRRALRLHLLKPNSAKTFDIRQSTGSMPLRRRSLGGR